MPSGNTKLSPLPFNQVLPPLRLYCQLPPGSRLPTSIVPLLVMRSLLELPVSSARLSVGVSAEWSTVIASSGVKPSLPARSTTRARNR